MFRPQHPAVVALIAVLVAAMTGGGPIGVQLASNGPPDPATVTETGDPSIDDNIYYGAVPAGGESAPVLVFVPGMGRSARDWWTDTPYDGVNDMYVAAWGAGYRTAFVTLDYPQEEPPHSIWTNGGRLAAQLEAIVCHYGVGQVDLITHSKGGVDAQVAVVYEDAAPLVRRVFTLAGPHHGSELANLIHLPVARGLAEALGLINEASDCLQTDVMSQFRAATDPQSAQQPVTYHTAAGTDLGPARSVTRFTGLYLSIFGPNDGLVTVSSAELPGAERLFVQPYHHFNIHMGHTAFPWIDAVLEGRSARQRAYLPVVAANTGALAEDQLVAGLAALRGGRLTAPVTHTLSIREPDARTASFVLLASQEAVVAKLTGSDGVARWLEVASGGWVDILGNAVLRTHVEQDPTGDWTIELEGPTPAAYLLVVFVESPLRVAVRGVPDKMPLDGHPLRLTATAYHPAGRATLHRMEAWLARYSPDLDDDARAIATSGGTSLSWMPPEEGLYAMQIVVKGETGLGRPFERTFVRSLLVGEEVPVCEPEPSSAH